MRNARISGRLLLEEDLHMLLRNSEGKLEVGDGEGNCLSIIVETEQVDLANNCL